MSTQTSGPTTPRGKRCPDCLGRTTIVDPISGDEEPYTCPACGGSGLAADHIDPRVRSAIAFAGSEAETVWLVVAGPSGMLDRIVPDLLTGQSVCADLLARLAGSFEVIEDWQNLNTPEASVQRWARYVRGNDGRTFEQSVTQHIVDRSGSWFPTQPPLKGAVASDQEDPWCREERCRHRHWRSGSMPTHRRGADCPPTTPITRETTRG